ncbi:MAG: hypothetical protein JWN67_2415 [Actinomycetia bacterium]|nr:hypothetical protein [Actinomycetes bacterium]
METPFGDLPDRHVASMSMAERHAALSRRTFLGGALAGGVALAFGPTLWRQPGYAATPASAPHLQYGADPMRQMVVSWSTDGPVQGAVLDVGTDRGYGRVIQADSRAVRGTKTVYHHAVVDRLQPGGIYRYRPRHKGGVGAEGHFRTAPSQADRFTFTAFGDQGTSAGARGITALVARQAPAFHVHAGDLCYAYSTGTGEAGPVNPATWDDWLGIISPVASTVPWMPAVGNHEMESGYGPQGYDGVLARFSLPHTGAAKVPSTWGFRYGNVAVLALDGNDASFEIPHNLGWTEGRQDAWLKATLTKLRRDPSIDFIVATYHHCSYCTNAVHSSDGGPRQRWDALFDDHDVDLVINGHNHCYERTHPLRRGKVADDGTIFVTAGGGGQTAYQASLGAVSYVNVEHGARVPEPSTWSATRYNDLSFLACDVAGKRMTLRAIKADGSEIERVVLDKSRDRATAAAS